MKVDIGVLTSIRLWGAAFKNRLRRGRPRGILSPMKILTAFCAAALAAALCAAPGLAQGPSPFTGISTVEFGDGGPPFDYPHFEVSFDAPNCLLTTKFVPNPNEFIGNYYLVANYLIYGETLLPQPLFLDPPFYGHQLYVLPIDIISNGTGGISTYSIPPDPVLVGKTFYLQDIGQYMYTLSLPPQMDFILTYGIAMTFL
jgi:hypothetical protein